MVGPWVTQQLVGQGYRAVNCRRAVPTRGPSFNPGRTPPTLSEAVRGDTCCHEGEDCTVGDFSHAPTRRPVFFLTEGPITRCFKRSAYPNGQDEVLFESPRTRSTQGFPSPSPGYLAEISVQGRTVDVCALAVIHGLTADPPGVRATACSCFPRLRRRSLPDRSVATTRPPSQTRSLAGLPRLVSTRTGTDLQRPSEAPTVWPLAVGDRLLLPVVRLSVLSLAGA